MFEFNPMPGQEVISSFSGEYSFLSNFYTAEIELDFGGTLIKFPSVEHAFQASKTLNADEALRISKEPTPASAKKAGGRRGYITLRPDWEQVKYSVMLNLLRAKFFNNEYLKIALLETRDAILIEGNTWRDTDWGMCRGIGENHLGTLLMQVRNELQQVFGRIYNYTTRCYKCLMRCEFCKSKDTCTMRGHQDRMIHCYEHPCNLTLDECDEILNSINRA